LFWGRKKFLSQSGDENIIPSALKTTKRERSENENVHTKNEKDITQQTEESEFFRILEKQQQ
jgi:hypothetical protein